MAQVGEGIVISNTSTLYSNIIIIIFTITNLIHFISSRKAEKEEKAKEEGQGECIR